MSVSGLDRLKARLAKMPEAVKKAAKAANEANADELVATTKRLAPVKTGALRKSIHKEPGATETAVRVVAGDGVAHYARWVEFGTAPHSLAKGASRKRGKKQGEGLQHPGAKPEPFFFPAYRSLKKRLKSRVARAAGKAIKEGASQ